MGKLICADCKEELLSASMHLCPYCGSKKIVPYEEYNPAKIEKIEKLIKTGRYTEAAQAYEELEMWEKAGECRKLGKKSSVVSANINVGKVASISMNCPHCNASQPLVSKSNEVTCSYCKKSYIIPKKVLDLL